MWRVDSKIPPAAPTLSPAAGGARGRSLRPEQRQELAGARWCREPSPASGLVSTELSLGQAWGQQQQRSWPPAPAGASGLPSAPTMVTPHQNAPSRGRAVPSSRSCRKEVQRGRAMGHRPHSSGHLCPTPPRPPRRLLRSLWEPRMGALLWRPSFPVSRGRARSEGRPGAQLKAS